jgi:uncharacterized membrane-anchored protein
MLKPLCLGGCLLLASPALAAAQDAPADSPDPQRIALLKDILASEHPQKGDVHLAAAGTTLHLGDRYYFLGPADSKRVLVEAWRNPAGSADGVLGLIFPAGATFDDSWGAVVTYEATGHVSDKDAATADYDKLLEQSRKDEGEVNAQRQKAGFPAIHLVGWAQAPTYDAASHSEVWARDIQFTGQSVDTLNYDTRILGRAGVLSLNLVSAMDALSQTRDAANELARNVAFDPGARYEDFQKGSDKEAEYGIGGLIAAGMGVAVAQKFGLLAALLLFAKKGLVVIVAAGAWLMTRVRRMLGLAKPKPAPALPVPPAAADDTAP